MPDYTREPFTWDSYLAFIELTVFDVDGTLVEPKSGKTFRTSADDWQWLPGRRTILTRLQSGGIGMGVALATNQGGVAFGYHTEEDITAQLKQMGEEVGGFAYVGVCYAHPKATVERYRAGVERRKPSGAMIREAMEFWHSDAGHTLMVGDRPEDQQAAEDAGCMFVWSTHYFAVVGDVLCR